MKIHLEKHAIRAMGIAECSKRTAKNSTLCAVVMRSDLVIDGCNYGECKIGGDDITKNIILLYKKMKRTDINLIMILGSILSSYNIINLHALYDSLAVPIISVSLKSPKNLELNFKNKFPDTWKQKIKIYIQNGEVLKISTKTGYVVYVNVAGLSTPDTKKVINKFLLQGSIPEPIRIAKLFARAKIINEIN